MLIIIPRKTQSVGKVAVTFFHEKDTVNLCVVIFVHIRTINCINLCSISMGYLDKFDIKNERVLHGTSHYLKQELHS